MAKKKITLEEKLEEAIVKDIPYEIPQNWIWSKLDSISTLVTGNTPSKKNLEYYGENVPFIKPNDLDQGRRLKSSIEMLSSLGAEKARILPKGSTAVCCIGSIGKTAYLEVEGATNQQINSIIPNKVNNLYIYYYVLSEYFQRELISNSSATTISIINKSKMGELAIAVPPLKEQQRIVDKIESLFEKLDKSKELIEEARDDFEKRKSVITYKAFRGKLNERNGCIKLDKGLEGYYKVPENWEWLKLKDVCEKITDGTHKSPKSYSEGKYKYVTAKNIKEWGIDLSNITYLTKEDHQVIYNRCDVQFGDVLYIKDGATTGIATINELDEEFSLLSSVAMLRVNSNLINKYLAYVLNSNEIKTKILESVKGVAITRLTLKKINEIIIPVPPLEEQKEIVGILDQLLGEESKIEELTRLEDQIELIKKSILAKAFRGQLGTNCEDDESALELLKEILNK
ncbi:restriction endonuclease subunit S [Clostridium ihumii]|uniref:restriction endonuclease subunit S n=1 Tax=Clostridium ihumii TaxID=1470356 RepID=UPI00058D33D2|nr:restriction endonuclease subunit S [Clostridium ihumii]